MSQRRSQGWRLRSLGRAQVGGVASESLEAGMGKVYRLSFTCSPCFGLVFCENHREIPALTGLNAPGPNRKTLRLHYLPILLSFGPVPALERLV